MFRDDWFKVSKTDPSIRIILEKTFPDYKGRKIQVCPQEYALDVRSYWSGGSRSYFVAINMKTMQILSVPQNGTPFDGGPIAPNGVMIPRGFAIVERMHFDGKDFGIRIHIHKDMLPKMLKGG